jgi:alpha-beta hydrolase superfamily lysophospholipase
MTLRGFTLRFLVSSSLLIGSYSAVTVAFQEFFIFPLLFASRFSEKGNSTSPLPSRASQFLLEAEDGAKLNVWHVPSAQGTPEHGLALSFHGNGQTLRSSVGHVYWASKQGFSAYGMDYRGIGASEGWPDEEKIRSDVLTLWSYVQKREPKNSKRLLIMGHSLGTGPAAFLASKTSPTALLLVSPFTSLKDLVSERVLLGYLARFLRFEFPVAQHIRELGTGCVVVAAGKRDGTVPYHHSLALSLLESKEVRMKFLSTDKGGHGTTWNLLGADIAQAVQECFDDKSYVNGLLPPNSALESPNS